jgi:hypothetical protein
MWTILWLFSAGSVIELRAWGFSLNRRRGKEVWALVHAHHLHVDTVHEASIRALQYGVAEDFSFLVKKAHPTGEHQFRRGEITGA